jgi:hypothetical protein
VVTHRASDGYDVPRVSMRRCYEEEEDKINSVTIVNLVVCPHSKVDYIERITLSGASSCSPLMM